MRLLSTTAATLAILTLLNTTAAQQGTKPTSQPTSQPKAKPNPDVATTQDPVKPAPEPTAQERLAALRATLDKLKREKKLLKSIQDSGGLAARIRQRIKARNITGAPMENVGPAMPAKKRARLMGDAEKADLPDDVIFTVEGMPVRTQEYDSLLAYLRSYPRKKTADEIKSETILALVEAKAALAQFKADVKKARTKIEAIQKQLKDGGKFRDLARQHSQDSATAKKGGDLGYVTRDKVDALLAKTMFTLKLGDVSGILQTPRGFYIVRVTGAKKGETADQDRVRASQIAVLYTKDANKMKSLVERIRSADVDVAFRDEELRKFVPKQWR